MLESMTEQQVDSIIVQSQNDPKGNAIFKSREEYEFELGNSRLTLASDQEIINHFEKHKEVFNRIKNDVLVELESKEIDSERTTKVGEVHQVALNRIYISNIFTSGYNLGKCIGFLIGGILDNSVGLLFAKDKKDLPKMNPHRIIMTREIGNGWYLYKTT